MSSYFVVDHVSDSNKTDGLVESYQMIPVQYDNGQGGLSTGYKRLNFVHWPTIPNPFVHEEWSEDLIFTNVYTPELDDAYGDDDEDEDEDEEEADFSDEDSEDYEEAEGGEGSLDQGM